jgi:hypothetical protein
VLPVLGKKKRTLNSSTFEYLIENVSLTYTKNQVIRELGTKWSDASKSAASQIEMLWHEHVGYHFPNDDITGKLLFTIFAVFLQNFVMQFLSVHCSRINFLVLHPKRLKYFFFCRFSPFLRMMNMRKIYLKYTF